MASSVIHLTGYVSSDIEVGTAKNGSQVAKFSIPMESEKDAEGRYKPTSVWARITVWGTDRVARLLKYVQKGTQVHVYGKFKVAPYLSNKSKDAMASVDITADDVSPLVYNKAVDAGASATSNGDYTAPRTTTGRAQTAEPTVF